MSNELISILVLVAVFLVATTTGINMGVLGIVAAFIVGTAMGVSEDDIFAGFPGDLFVILVGVTYLFAIASGNGTVDWLIHRAVQAVGGRTAALPWVMFIVTAALTASGAVVPGAVAIVAPIALGFAIQYGINPVLMGLFVINGATAGGFSPISVFGSIVNGVVENNNLAENPTLLFFSSLVFNTLLSVVVFFLFGGRKLIGHRVDPAAVAAGEGEGEDEAERTRRFERRQKERAEKEERAPIAGGAAVTADDAGGMPELDRDKILTLIGIVALIIVALAFDVDVGFVALTIASVLSLVSPDSAKAAVGKIAWPTVLLISGIVMYVGLLETLGSIDWLGEQVASINSALLAALLICYVGGVVSAFASTTGILAALIPLAVPLLETGAIGAVGVIIALSISSSVVDSSPFSTSGALTVANTPESHRDRVFRRLMQWGMSMVLVAPPIAWLVFVAPGWL
jgi:Na+/H+ antiporter NhaD/arsenite permease-like protein